MQNSTTFSLSDDDLTRLATLIKTWGRELGFQQVGITDTQLAAHEKHLATWLEKGHHGDMSFMAKHGTKRTRPEELEPGTQRVISVRMDYLPAEVESTKVLGQPSRAYVSRYALGRDYHKLMRKRLAQLAKKIEQQVGAFGYRAFVDSAPVMERALAQKAGLGWFGKNAMLLNPKAGSLFSSASCIPTCRCLSMHRLLMSTVAAVAPVAPPAQPVPLSMTRSSTRANAFLISLLNCMARYPLSFAAPWVTVFTVATTASWCVLSLASPALPRKMTLRRAMTLTAPTSLTYLPGAKTNFWIKQRAVPYGVLATNAGCAISPSAWAMPPGVAR